MLLCLNFSRSQESSRLESYGNGQTTASPKAQAQSPICLKRSRGPFALELATPICFNRVSDPGADPAEDTEEELSSSQDIVALFPCVGSEHQGGGQRSWSPDDDDQLTRLLTAPPRVYPRRRLEPLYEEEDGPEPRPRPRLLSDSSSSGGSSPDRSTKVRHPTSVRVP